MNPTKRREIFARLRENNPTPTTELEYASPFELLIAVMLSAQATDVSVNKATRKLFPVANTPAAILALGVDGVREYIKTIGLFNTKAENLMKTCHILVNQHGSDVPQTRQALEALPGVGRKTANVVTLSAQGEYEATPAPVYVDDAGHHLAPVEVPTFIAEPESSNGSGVRTVDR